MDASVRLISVQWIVIPISPADFEAERVRAIAAGANHVRPFMHILGDDRDAATLLMECAADFERCKLKNLSRHPEGRALLERLAEVGRERLRLILDTGREVRQQAERAGLLGRQVVASWNCSTVTKEVLE